MSTKKTLVILFGGKSSEHDASLKSFEHVLTRLNESQISNAFSAIKISYIRQNGSVLFASYEHSQPAAWYCKQDKETTLHKLFAYLANPDIFVFSLLHGQHGEDGCIQGLAAFLGISGSFGSTLSASLAMSKPACNTFVAGLSTDASIPKSTLVASLTEVPNALTAWSMGEKVVIKPSSLGASILTELLTIGKDNKKITTLLKKILSYDSAALMQEFIPGDEYSCGCLEENGAVTALPVVKVITQNQFFGHKEKHTLGSNEERVITPDAETSTETKIRRLSEELFQKIGLRHMSRFDFRVTTDKKIYFLEVNPLPGMMENSLFPKMLRAAGKNIEDVLLVTLKNSELTKQKKTEFRYHID